MRMYYLIAVLFVGAVAIACGKPNFAVQGVGPEVVEQKGSEVASGKIVNDEGWQIPGLADSRVEQPRTQVESLEGGARKYLTVIRPQSEPVSRGHSFSQIYLLTTDRDKVFHLRVRSVRVQRIELYDVDGRKYSYKVYVSNVFIDSDGTPQVTGKIYPVYYQDEDGDGKFESFYDPINSKSDVLIPIPKWVF